MPALKALLKLVETSLDADKAEQIVIIDLKNKTAIADYMVI
ncbi:MAG: ribosome silencing factor, partial [Rhodospirillales bacterium]|nr:ribosome silencing factor [Rhodospirillales bacterium]